MSAKHLRNAAYASGGAIGVYLGLCLPDLDLLLLPILHHRSIITHSILIPILLNKWIPVSVYLGFLAGISIHLWADSLSTSTGFAQIYLPIVKTGLGPALSFFWLLLNSLFGFYIAVRNHRKYIWHLLAVYLLVAFSYAVLNEGATFVAYVLAVIGAILFFKYRKAAKNESKEGNETL